MRTTVIRLAMSVLIGGTLNPAFAADELAQKAQAILKDRCYSCHGEGGAAEGGVNYVLDVPRLISRRAVIAKDAAKSKLYTQVKTGNMPKESEPLSKAEIETLKAAAAADKPA